MFKCGILSYGCSSSSGPTAQDFWNGLCAGTDHSRTLPGFSSRVCQWPDTDYSGQTALDLLVRHSLLAWKDCLNRLPSQTSFSTKKMGVILASTKGCIDDWIWKESPDLSRDSLTPVLDAFLKAAEIESSETICVSNACASSLTAIFLGQEWLRQKRVDSVLILAVDRAGKFIQKGFEKLKVVSLSTSQPFGRDRDGLCLGDSAAALLLSNEPGLAEIEGVTTDTEGFAVTRPGLSGTSLKKACLALPGIPQHAPDLIIAHGTGTRINDQIEDEVFDSLFGDRKIPVTATKWSVGHTLAASAAMDIIAACEVLTHQSIFHIANTREQDPTLKSRVLTAQIPTPDRFPAERVLVTSLGFGGVHAAALIKRGAQ